MILTFITYWYIIVNDEILDEVLLQLFPTAYKFIIYKNDADNMAMPYMEFNLYE